MQNGILHEKCPDLVKSRAQLVSFIDKLELTRFERALFYQFGRKKRRGSKSPAF
jgi:hypothetical protein